MSNLFILIDETNLSEFSLIVEEGSRLESVIRNYFPSFPMETTFKVNDPISLKVQLIEEANQIGENIDIGLD